jgi:hypothetical protein
MLTAEIEATFVGGADVLPRPRQERVRNEPTVTYGCRRPVLQAAQPASTELKEPDTMAYNYCRDPQLSEVARRSRRAEGGKVAYGTWGASQFVALRHCWCY